MKTNREKNQEHDAKELAKIRPKEPQYNYKPLEDVIRQWVVNNKWVDFRSSVGRGPCLTQKIRIIEDIILNTSNPTAGAVAQWDS